MWLYLLLIFSTVDSAYVFDFVHVLKDGIVADTAKGEIYRTDSVFYIKVKDPIEQVIYFSGDTMIVYYPVQKEAFKIKSGISFKLGAPGGPTGKIGKSLKNSGFIFIKREVVDGKRKEVWTHEKTKMKMICTFDGGTVTEICSIAAEGDTMLMVSYSNFLKFEGTEIPLSLRAVTPSNEETYELSNPRRIPFEKNLESSLKISGGTKITLKGFED
ncbi:MAG TPA: hypothetical protein PLY38_03085 [Candidatus Hydrothermia bacterium]|nr:hypothetical protein [Candidatus Hydrothermia bacterium]